MYTALAVKVDAPMWPGRRAWAGASRHPQTCKLNYQVFFTCAVNNIVIDAREAVVLLAVEKLVL